MSSLARRDQRALIPDLFDVLEFPLTAAFRPFVGQGIRIEEYTTDEMFVIRAELPGIDPDKNLEISAARGMLTIRAERQEEHEGRHHTEFRYGSYERHLRLPDNIKEDEIKATYDAGILTVKVPLKEAKTAGRRVPVEHQ